MAQMCLNLGISPPHLSDCTVDQEQSVVGQFADAEEDGKKKTVVQFLNTPDPSVVCRICEEKQNNRSMICCTGCQGWFHGDCVGDMKTEGKEYICLVCIEPNLLQADLSLETDLGMSSLKSLMQSPPAEDNEEVENQQTQSTLELMEVDESPLVLKTEPDPTSESQSSSPHAAATIKNLSVPKAPKTRARAQRKPRTQTQPQTRRTSSRRLANRGVLEESKEEEEQSESESSQTCDSSVTEAQATQCNASAIEDQGLATDVSEVINLQSRLQTMPLLSQFQLHQSFRLRPMS
ncbi:hypothetical protein WMY93_005489 [Mugilogobius chulae]|uniref:PHD-type domain-containing protein n=1 Tax=Mugilogobius chulae TaxID=88201 RepID=A0AAW0PSR4_9GOBI